MQLTLYACLATVYYSEMDCTLHIDSQPGLSARRHLAKKLYVLYTNCITRPNIYTYVQHNSEELQGCKYNNVGFLEKCCYNYSEKWTPSMDQADTAAIQQSRYTCIATYRSRGVSKPHTTAIQLEYYKYSWLYNYAVCRRGALSFWVKVWEWRQQLAGQLQDSYIGEGRNEGEVRWVEDLKQSIRICMELDGWELEWRNWEDCLIVR